MEIFVSHFSSDSSFSSSFMNLLNDWVFSKYYLKTRVFMQSIFHLPSSKSEQRQSFVGRFFDITCSLVYGETVLQYALTLHSKNCSSIQVLAAFSLLSFLLSSSLFIHCFPIMRDKSPHTVKHLSHLSVALTHSHSCISVYKHTSFPPLSDT